MSAQARLVAADDFYLPKEQCPCFDLNALPWMGDTPPVAFVKRGAADMNVPGSLDWNALHTATLKAIDKASRSGEAVIVEGHLLLGEHSGATSLRELINWWVLLTTDDDGEQELCRRKWSRKHGSKNSYLERGVTLDEYRWLHLLAGT